MLEQRSIIHVGGSPGSGKSRLASAVAAKLEAQAGIVAEHISLGDRLRHIGRGTIESIYRREVIDHLSSPDSSTARLREDVVKNIVLDALEDSNRKDVDVVLLDGYPRYPDQVETLQFFSVITERALAGCITTVIDERTALARIMKRSSDHRERRLDDRAAHKKLENYYENSPQTMMRLREVLPPRSMHYITSNLSPAHTAEAGYKAALEILNPREPLEPTEYI
jgi:adenylate kinase family enzyme